MIIKKESLLFILLYIAMNLPNQGKCTKYEDNEQLVKMLSRVRDDTMALFSGAFAAVTAFTCRDVNGRLELLRGLSRTFLSSSVLDIDQSGDRIADLAWQAGYKGREIPIDAHRQLFILDLDCPESTEFLQKANSEMMFAAPYKWLILQQTNNTNELDTTFTNIGIYPDSEVLVWLRSDNNNSDQLLSIYRTSSSENNHEIEMRGYWNSVENQLVVKDRNVASRRRRNLAGTRLKSCIVVRGSVMMMYTCEEKNIEPRAGKLFPIIEETITRLYITDPDTINHLTDYHERHIDSITKCNYPWALHLVNMLNATVTFERANTWGYMSPNGSWGGMIGMLQRGEIDFGGTGTFLLLERIGVIQYISLSTPTGSRFIFRRPPLSSISNLFKLPFRDSVWLAISALVFLLIVLLYPVMRFEWKQLKDEPGLLEPRQPTLSDDVLVIVGAVSQQGFWYEARTVSSRIIVLMGLLAALNLYAAYTANIVALLQSTTTSINTLKDLLESPLTLAAHDNVYNRYYFKSFKDPVRKTIFEERIEPRGAKKTNWLAIEDGIENIRKGYFAFHVEPGCAYKIIQETYGEDEKCGFHEIDYLNVFDPHFIVKRRSPYLELLKVGALRLSETGLRTRELSRLYTKKPSCGSARRFLSVGLTECYGAFSVLLYGLLLAFGLFLAEMIATRLSSQYLLD